MTRVAVARTRELTGATVRRIRSASHADGAGTSGLAQLLWLNAVHLAGDALVAVSLAGTLFFAAPADAQRGNVALYLLVTMAPFALLAPVIGPALDRLQRGRRWAMAGSLAGRAVLALVMAAHLGDWLLYPAAFGILVLSKAHNVLRAAVVPRVLPPGLPLTSANSRLSVFGLITAALAGALGLGLAALLGTEVLLWGAAAVLAAGAVLAVRLPRPVDVATGEVPATVLMSTASGRRRVVSVRVRTALRANAALRALGGFLTIFSAFLVQASFSDGGDATLALAGLAAVAGLGSLAGTAIGARLRSTPPDLLVLACAGLAVLATALAALLYSFAMAVVVAGLAALTNALGKVALDAIIQRDVPDALRASAFARSETVLQLAWVLGGGLGVALPTVGRLGFSVAAGLLAVAVGGILWRVHRPWSASPERSDAARPDAERSDGARPGAPTTPLGTAWS